MDTIYNVGDTVFIKAKVKEIYVDEKGIRYTCLFTPAFGDSCELTVGPGILKKSSLLFTDFDPHVIARNIK